MRLEEVDTLMFHKYRDAALYAKTGNPHFKAQMYAAIEALSDQLNEIRSLVKYDMDMPPEVREAGLSVLKALGITDEEVNKWSGLTLQELGALAGDDGDFDDEGCSEDGRNFEAMQSDQYDELHAEIKRRKEAVPDA